MASANRVGDKVGFMEKQIVQWMINNNGTLKVPFGVFFLLCWGVKDTFFGVYPYLPYKLTGGHADVLNGLLHPVPFFLSVFFFFPLLVLYRGAFIGRLFLIEKWHLIRYGIGIIFIVISLSFILEATVGDSGIFSFIQGVINGLLAYYSLTASNVKIVFSKAFLQIRQDQLLDTQSS